MIVRDARFICDATGGALFKGANVAFSDVSIDTRTITQGAAFFCLKGPNFDGHRFASDAIKQGASIVIVQRDSVELVADLQGGDYCIVVVDDTEKALGDTAASWRRAHTVTLVGLTGSSGKTTTKELLSAVLQTQGETLATQGNLNNHLGVPLTLLRLRKAHRFAVIEMGMNAPGEIDYLATIARPNLGVITTVGRAHTEGVGSLDGVADAKGELLRALPEGSLALIPSAIQKKDRLLAGVEVRIESVGEAESDQIRLISDEDTDTGAAGQIIVDGETHRLTIKLSGRHNLDNAMLALAAGRACGVSMEAAVSALAEVAPPTLRGEIRTLADQTEIVLDCYNANPQSMRAAIGDFVGRHPVGVLALGDMLELGAAAAEEHVHLGRFVANLSGQPELIGVGSLSKYTVEGALQAGMESDRASWYSDASTAATHVGKRCDAQHALLLKGSRGMRMEHIFEVLSEERGQ